MKNVLGFAFFGFLLLQGCGSSNFDQESKLQVEQINLIENETLLNSQLASGKTCVSRLSFFEGLYWNGFQDEWEVQVEDNFDIIPEADRVEARLYEQVLRYQIGCNFAKKKVTEEKIRSWANQIKSKKDQPELILPEIKVVYTEAQFMLKF